MRYKRKKFKISESFIVSERIKKSNKQYFEELNTEVKNKLFNDIDLFSKRIAAYVFRSNDYVEDIHSHGKDITDSDMKQINKYMVNRISELLLLSAGNEWIKMEFILNAKAISVGEWDECEPDMDEIDQLFYMNIAPDHIARWEKGRLYNLPTSKE